MKRNAKPIKRTLCGLILAVGLLLCALPCTAETEYRLFAVSAGKADALILQAGHYSFLIDTGYARSRGKILYALELLGIERLDGVFLTHTDDDHADGLDWLSESSLPVEAWYASAMYLGGKESKHPAVRAAAARGQEVAWLQEGDVLELGEAVLEVLAPGALAEDKEDNNSLVMMLRTPYGKMLLCGDMEYPEEARLLAGGADVRCDVLKIPNHADDDVCSREFLKAASPSVSVISTSTAEKPETPDPGLMMRLSGVCGTILQTQDATAGVLISLTSEGTRWEYVDLPAAEGQLEILSVNAPGDLVTLRNAGTAEVDLSGWYLTTQRKNALFVFPEGTELAPGEEIRVGSLSSSVKADFTWRETKLINRKKEDGVTLYDPFGNEVSYKGNGF